MSDKHVKEGFVAFIKRKKSDVKQIVVKVRKSYLNIAEKLFCSFKFSHIVFRFNLIPQERIQIRNKNVIKKFNFFYSAKHTDNILTSENSSTLSNQKVYVTARFMIVFILKTSIWQNSLYCIQDKQYRRKLFDITVKTLNKVKSKYKKVF